MRPAQRQLVARFGKTAQRQLVARFGKTAQL